MEKKTYEEASVPRARCLECGERMTGYRINKKFCCNSCRDRHHNKERTTKRKFHKVVDEQLKINYAILSGLISSGRHSAELGEVVSKGFNMSFVTSIIRTRTFTSFTCYDISFRISDTKVFNIYRISLNLP